MELPLFPGLNLVSKLVAVLEPGFLLGFRFFLLLGLLHDLDLDNTVKLVPLDLGLLLEPAFLLLFLPLSLDLELLLVGLHTFPVLLFLGTDFALVRLKLTLLEELVPLALFVLDLLLLLTEPLGFLFLLLLFLQLFLFLLLLLPLFLPLVFNQLLILEFFLQNLVLFYLQGLPVLHVDLLHKLLLLDFFLLLALDLFFLHLLDLFENEFPLLVLGILLGQPLFLSLLYLLYYDFSPLALIG